MRLSLRSTFLLVLALPLSLAAQVFPVESGSAWRGIIYGLAGPIPVASVMCGDTTINTIKYSKFYQINYGLDGTYYNSNYRACTRIDGQKVWVIANGATQEILLYDFGVEVGDTLHLQFVDFDQGLDYYTESIEQINIGGVLHKMIRFQTSYGIPDVWIEGIGSIMGPLDRGFFVIDAQPALTCYLKDGDVVYKTAAEQECEGGLTCAIVSGNGEVPDLNAFKVFPNPANAAIWIKSDVPGPIQVEIFTADGRLVSKAAYPDGQFTQVSTESLAPAIYLFRIAPKDNPFSSKFHRVAVVR
jgi:hypothetical protein